MLNTLTLKNFALFSECRLHLDKGFTVLTGETGAGKSIIIDAIGLLLGKASQEGLIKSGEEKASVEGVFTLNHIPEVLAPYCEDKQLIIFRQLSKSKSNIIRLNDQSITLKTLKSIAPYLANINGQHDYMTLLSTDAQRNILDQFGRDSLAPNFKSYQTHYHHFLALQKDLKSFDVDDQNLEQQEAFLNFQIDDIKQQGFSFDEEETLLDQKRLLKTFTKEKDSFQKMEHGFSQTQDLLLQLQQQASQINSEENSENNIDLHDILSAVEAQHMKLSRLTQSLNELDGLDINTIESRLDVIFKYKSKYRCNTLNDLCELYDSLKKQRERLTDKDQKLQEVQKELDSCTKQCQNEAKKINQARQAAADKLGQLIESKLKGLDFNAPQCKITLTHDPEKLTAHGADHIQFMVSLNAGQPTQPIDKVASGGELSRMMLALSSILYLNSPVETLIYDEIDTGVGGLTALKIGTYLNDIAKHHQVLCITHLAQIAKVAQHHFLIEKTEKLNKVVTSVCHLSSEDKQEELARMVGGQEVLQLFNS